MRRFDDPTRSRDNGEGDVTRQPSGVAQMQPGQALLREDMPRRAKLGGVAKGADVEMGFGRRGIALAGQGRPAPRAKSPPPAGRRIEFGDLTLGHDIGVAFEGYKDGDRRTAVLAATFAMAPRHRFRLARRHKAHRTAQTAALEALAHIAQLSASPSDLRGRPGPWSLVV